MDREEMDTRGHADRAFIDYYAKQSITPDAIQRFESIHRIVANLLTKQGTSNQSLDVLDVGCNAGTQCIMWANHGHNVHGIDINEGLLNLASERTATQGLDIDYQLGSATDLPWPDNSMDVCLAPELLEHVPDWRQCLNEFVRILKPNGVLYLSTTNYLCPKQEEFNLRFYSWYPSILKERYERLSISTRPDIANYARYPAVNWFSFYSLREELNIRNMTSYDRFDVVDTENKNKLARLLIILIKRLSFLRLLGHFATPYTVILAVKNRLRPDN